jgi:hypothetical protein
VIDGKTYKTSARDEEGWDFSKKLLGRIQAIQYGTEAHPFSHLIPEKSN